MTIKGRSSNGRIAHKNVLERLWENSTGDSDDQCWEYHVAPQPSGHTRIRCDDKTRIMTHRLAWEAYHAEPVPEGMQVNHHCDNPKCFNPHHLYIGTQSDNMKDRAKRKPKSYPCKISPEDRDLIRSSSESDAILAARYDVTKVRINQIRHHRR